MENSPTDTAKKEIPSPTEPATTTTSNTTPIKTDTDTVPNNADSSSTNVDGDAETTDPTLLPPPPRPSSNSGTSNNNNSNSDTYFATNQPAASHLSFEPNPFEHSFAGGGGSNSAGDSQTPGGTKLPPVASITSPSSLLPGGGTTPYPWGSSSLRTGPLSPAMLSGPTGDYFGDTNHLRGGFTPNESSLRTGLTPGGGGTMFPSPSPNSQAIFNQLAGATSATPTVDFHRSALAASHRKQSEATTPSNITSQPQRDVTNGDHAATTPAKQLQQQQREPFAQHDANDAANGLFLLASQSRTNSVGPGASGQYAMAPQQPVHAHPSGGGASQPRELRNGSRGGGGGVSEGSEDSEDRSSSRVTRGKGRKGGAGARRKAEEVPVASKAPPAKKGKHGGGSAASQHYMEPEPPSEEEDVKQEEYNANGKKMTDEEKRKNFLERNRVAALKCRQRKKQWLANLQQKVEIFSSENDSLTNQLANLREEVIQLKTRLLAHKDCPVSQSQAMGGYLGGIEFGGGAPPGMMGQGMPAGMPAGMQGGGMPAGMQG
ncbi:hypothetical protein V501_06168, partial [Pseudogymnoascus sp. VKM F-4519 (FW-2642)]